jgi:hypothetical protein
LDESSARRKGLYRHRTTQQTQERNIHDPSGIRTHYPSNQAANTYTLRGHREAEIHYPHLKRFLLHRTNSQFITSIE